MFAMSNPLVELSDCLHQIRELANDTDINAMIQDKKYMELAQRMATIGRHSNQCAGIFFNMYMEGRPKEEVIDEPSRDSQTS